MCSLFRTDLSIYFPDAESAPAHAAAIGDVDALVEFYDSTISALLDRHAPGCDFGNDVRTTGLMTHVTTPRFARVI